jgi:hypothetical protein
VIDSSSAIKNDITLEHDRFLGQWSRETGKVGTDIGGDGMREASRDIEQNRSQSA